MERGEGSQSQEDDAITDNISLPNMLRLLEQEEAVLIQMQSKLSDELHRIQVEEHVFLHALKILGEKHSNKESDKNGDEVDEMIEAIEEALLEEGDVMHDVIIEKDEKSF